ncbi:MAG: phytase [Algoriphagus sp.]|jgi:3-phytase|uniref:phytase n=1 Tax=Algoriphagus sp. TaxID=1872435 RepID=UPI002747C948|nr:phytase [Algoriphagus sp.]
MGRPILIFSLFIGILFSCKQEKEKIAQPKIAASVITDTVSYDTDDPAIWMHPSDPSKSLVIGTDKDSLGALYVFNLEGKVIDSLVRKGIQRPNNVDVGYGLALADGLTDFAVTGERLTSRLRFFSLPDMKELNPGGFEIFLGEEGPDFRDLMGVALYKSPSTGKQYVIAGRKNGPKDGTYLWQYEITAAADDIQLELVRKFGQYSGKKEIEAIAVDAALGYIYYSDEGVGVRKYAAEPDMGNEELALFATEGFADDHEGISIYEVDDSSGYLLVSDQQANLFHVFPREGSPENPHAHPLITKILLSTNQSDGSEVSSRSFGPKFPRGIFIAMSDNKTFHFYRWEDVAGKQLKTRKNN